MTEVHDFHFTPLGKVVLAVTSIQLVPGVGRQHFAIQVQLSASWLEQESKEVFPVLVTGRLFSDQPGMSPVGAVSPLTSVVRGYQTHETLYVDLADEQIYVLDARRGGGDLSFRFNVELTLLRDPSNSWPTAAQQMCLRIDRGSWLTQLDTLGQELGITIRVPSPLTDAAGAASASQETVASAAQAGARLRQARSELRDAQYERCVATCRLVLENLDLMTPRAAEDSKPKRDRTLDERWRAVMADMKSLTHAAHHDDDITRDFVWTRVDAEAALATVAALTARVLRT